MTDNAGQMGNVRLPTAGQKAGQRGAPPLGGDPLSGLSERVPRCRVSREQNLERENENSNQPLEHRWLHRDRVGQNLQGSTERRAGQIRRLEGAAVK